MRHFLYPAVVGLLVFAQGCAVAMNMPAVRFDSPEAQGSLGRGYVQGGIGGGNLLEIIPDTTADSPDDNRSFSGSGYIPIMAGVGLTDRLDIEARLQSAINGTSIPILKAKYQLLGSPRIEAKAGNFALAASVGAGAVSHTQNDVSLGTVSAATDEHFWEFDSAIIAGYRFTDGVMIYGGPFYTHYGFHGTDAQSGQGAALPFAFAGTANQTGCNIGLAAGMDVFQIKLEEAYAYATSGATNISGFSSGVALVLFW